MWFADKHIYCLLWSKQKLIYRLVWKLSQTSAFLLESTLEEQEINDIKIWIDILLLTLMQTSFIFLFKNIVLCYTRYDFVLTKKWKVQVCPTWERKCCYKMLLLPMRRTFFIWALINLRIFYIVKNNSPTI